MKEELTKDFILKGLKMMKANETQTLIKTPEEAIETIKSNMPTIGYQMLRESLDMEITAIKEIQQYREVDAQIKKIFDDQLGLVDIVKEYIEDIRRTHNGKTPRKVIALSVMEDK